MLLQFTVENFRSFDESSTISAMRRGARGSRGTHIEWVERTSRAIGVYGPNGSGKTNLLRAIWYAVQFIRFSATRWSDRPETDRQPFRLGDVNEARPTSFEFDFVLNGIRHIYGFSLVDARVEEEFLVDFAQGRSRLLFERSKNEYKFGRGLRGENVVISRGTNDRALYLSVAAGLKHDQLAQVFNYFKDNFRFAQFDDANRSSRLNWARKALEDPGMLLKAQTLLQYSDIGIRKIVLHELDDSDVELKAFKSMFERLSKAMSDESDVGSDEKVSNVRVELTDDTFESYRKRLRFVHEGGDESDAFEQRDESSGTLAWLSLAIPALKAIEDGGLLMIDELDASLHPRLASAILSLFKNPRLNKSGAQVLFTSHDATLMGQFEHSRLDSDEVWFCEKNLNGSTALYSLLEFAPRTKDNFERRYLLGRYGAVPMLTEDELASKLSSISSKIESLELA